MGNLVLYSNLDVSVDLLALTLFNILALLVAVVEPNKIIEEALSLRVEPRYPKQFLRKPWLFKSRV